MKNFLKNFLKKKRLFLSFFVLVFLCVLIGFYLMYPIKISDTKRIDMGIKAISKMVKKDGKIVYNIDFLKNEESKKNNIVREMGTTYAIAFAYNQTQDKKLQKKLIKIFNRVKERCITTAENACVVSDNPEKIKIGATALALLGELFYEKTSADTQFSNLREQWVNAIMDLYVEGKGVRISPNRLETSPYFDGESWFALSVYHDMYPKNERAEKILSSLDEDMFRIYKDSYLISFVHWGLMASAQRYATTHNQKFLDFMKTQFQLYVLENPEPRQGSSTCSVSEGLSDVVYFVANYDSDFARQVLARLHQNTVKINDLQIISTEITGKNANEYPKIHPKTEKYIGAFKNTPDSYKTRNDVTQHCLTALLKRQRAIKAKEK